MRYTKIYPTRQRAGPKIVLKNSNVEKLPLSELESAILQLNKHKCRVPEPELLLNGTPIPVVEEVKFLGLIFDRKLSFLPHLRYLKNKCMKALNFIRVVAHTFWGADQHTFLHLYRSLVRSKLDYGCIMYGSARNSYLCMLDPVQNHAFCLCLCAYRTSPSPSFCIFANEPPSISNAGSFQ